MAIERGADPQPDHDHQLQPATDLYRQVPVSVGIDKERPAGEADPSARTDLFSGNVLI